MHIHMCSTSVCVCGCSICMSAEPEEAFEEWSGQMSYIILAFALLALPQEYMCNCIYTINIFMYPSNTLHLRGSLILE